jgi:hypothetical protein
VFDPRLLYFFDVLTAGFLCEGSLDRSVSLLRQEKRNTTYAMAVRVEQYKENKLCYVHWIYLVVRLIVYPVFVLWTINKPRTHS